MTRAELIKNRMFEKDFYTKKDWWGMGETILDNEEVKKEPLVVRKGLAIRHTLRNMPAYIKDYELVVGITMNASVGLGREMVDFCLPEEKEWALKEHSLTYKQHGDVHPADYDKLLRVGIKGLKAEINEQLDKEYLKDKAEMDLEKIDLFRGMLISLDAVIEFAHRYADICLMESRKAEDTQRAKELLEMSRVLYRVPENPAETFHEALQSFWLFYTVQHSIMEFMPAGRTDQYLYPYYKKDIEAGNITKEYARELLTSFLAKFSDCMQLNPEHWEWDHTTPLDEGWGGVNPDEAFFFSMQNDADWNLGSSANHFLMNMMLGGVTPEGEDATNDLTYMILEQLQFLETTSPIPSVRIHKDTPRDLLELVTDILRQGRGEPAIYIDDNVIPGLVASGIPVEDARQYANDGCWEVLIEGKTNYLYEHVHALKLMEYLLMNGKSLVSGEVEWDDCGDPSKYKTYEEFYDAYMKQVYKQAHDVVMNDITHFSGCRYKINPAVLLSTLTDDCIARGKDLFDKGARYRMFGLYITGFSHAMDSLAAIKKMVFEEKRITMAELVEAMRTNYEGKEDLRMMLINDVPKFGNGVEYVDEIASKFMKDFAEYVHELNELPEVKNAEPNYILQCAAGTFEHYVQFGRDCGASADGRPYMYTVASNYSPAMGLDLNGPTAVLKSATYPDLLPFYSGGPVDIGINANEIVGKEGTDRLISIIDSFREMGGMLMTLQVLNVDTLKDAQEHPENYPTLRVRLGGMSVFWNQLAEAQQDAIILRVGKMK